MTSNFLFGVSLTASFFAGMLALFAPCCITFLFPAYLGTIFKEGKKVIFYTFIFALGLSSILIPVALGFRMLIDFFNLYHQEVYYFGAAVLILMGLNTLRPFFQLPALFHTSGKTGGQTTAFSVFSLGVTSGLTSSCCAPVLFAAVTLTSLSPTIFQAIIVAGAYVLGIVFPLFFLSLTYQKTVGHIAGQTRQRLYAGLRTLGGGLFIITGGLIAVFNYLGKIQMYQMEGYSQAMRRLVFNFAGYFKNPLIDILSFSLIVIVFVKLVRGPRQ